jgi:hypothetical protein
MRGLPLPLVISGLAKRVVAKPDTPINSREPLRRYMAKDGHERHNSDWHSGVCDLRVGIFRRYCSGADNCSRRTKASAINAKKK